MTADVEPCIHLEAEPTVRCGIESKGKREAPRDCGAQCTAYAPETQTGEVLDPAERTRCEIWTRVMGYHRPVSAFNAGKQSEHRDRVLFRESAPRPRDGQAAGPERGTSE